MESPGRPYRLTASGAVGTAGKPVVLVSITVGKAVSGGTIAIYNGKDTGGTLLGTLAMDAAQTYQIGSAYFDAGCYLSITGASPDVLVAAR